MLIYSVAPVEQMPDVTLINWCVVESNEGERYFAGHCVEDGGGRFSTTIRVFDPATRLGITSSGRTYVLVGPAGYDSNASYLMNRIAAARDTTFTDVSAHMLSALYVYTPQNVEAENPLHVDLSRAQDNLMIRTTPANEPVDGNPHEQATCDELNSRTTGEFLNFLDCDMTNKPSRVQPLGTAMLGLATQWVAGTQVNFDAHVGSDDEQIKPKN